MWKLKDEESSRLFTHEIAARNDDVTKADDIQKKWLMMKECFTTVVGHIKLLCKKGHLYTVFFCSLHT